MPYHRKDDRVFQNIQRLMDVAHVREILLMNDGCSWDPMEQIADLPSAASAIYPPAIRIIRNERTTGVSGARNTGLLHATQPLICFLDYDDEILANRFVRDMEHFSDPACHATVCEFETCYESEGSPSEYWQIPYTSQQYLDGGEFFNNTYLGVPHLTCFTYRRSRLLELGIRFDEDLRGSEDTLFKYRCVDQMGFRTSPGLSAVRIIRHAHNTTADVYSRRLLEYRLHFFRRFSEIYVKYPTAHGHFQQSYLKTLRRYARKPGNPFTIHRHFVGWSGAWMRRYLSGY